MSAPPAPHNEGFDADAFWQMVEENSETYGRQLWVKREYLGEEWFSLSEVLKEREAS